jgi:hypothetical protein
MVARNNIPNNIVDAVELISGNASWKHKVPNFWEEQG